MQDESPARASSKIKELEVMVADVIVETADTSTLVFFTGNDRLVYEAGHFLTIDPHQFEALDRTNHIVHVCAGSGSVPNLSILKFALAYHPRLRHTFIYSNKTWDD